MERFKNYLLATMGLVIFAGAISLTETGRALAAQTALVGFTNTSGAPVGNTVQLDQTTAGANGVNVKNLPATQAVSGSVGVNNFPATQAVTGQGIFNIRTNPRDTHLGVAPDKLVKLLASGTCAFGVTFKRLDPTSGLLAASPYVVPADTVFVATRVDGILYLSNGDGTGGDGEAIVEFYSTATHQSPQPYFKDAVKVNNGIGTLHHDIGAFAVPEGIEPEGSCLGVYAGVPGGSYELTLTGYEIPAQ